MFLSKSETGLGSAAAWWIARFVDRLVEQVLDTSATVVVTTRRFEDIFEVVCTGDASGRHGWAGGFQSDVAM